jgi:hypothetical protein
VTPNVLHAELARQALAYVAGGNPDPSGALGLIGARNVGTIGWTEYSLYSTVAALKGNLFDYHLTSTECYLADITLASARSSVWHAEDFARLSGLPFGNDPGGKFIVVQSHTRIPVPEVRKYCLKFGRPMRRTSRSSAPSSPASGHDTTKSLGCLAGKVASALSRSAPPPALPNGWIGYFLPVVREGFSNADGSCRQTLIASSNSGSAASLAHDLESEDSEAVAVFVDNGNGTSQQVGYLPKGHALRPQVAGNMTAAWLGPKERANDGRWTAFVYVAVRSGASS